MKNIRSKRGQRGFSILETVFAGAIMFVALSGIIGLFAHSLLALQYAQEDLIAKQKAREALEAVFNARNTAEITFAMLNNVSTGGIFVDSWQPLRTAGVDGIIGTADDGAVETIVFPGPDGVIGTGDDVITPLSNFSRRITIAPVTDALGVANPDLNQVTVDVRYTVGQLTRTYTAVSYISRYR